MTPLLLDASLSPETSLFLRTTFAVDVVDLRTLGLSALPDADVVLLAKRQGRVIVIVDLDFGELYHRGSHGSFGVIVLRLVDQSVESVNRVLESFFQGDAAGIDLISSLVLLDGERRRVVRSMASPEA